MQKASSPTSKFLMVLTVSALFKSQKSGSGGSHQVSQYWRIQIHPKARTEEAVRCDVFFSWGSGASSSVLCTGLPTPHSQIKQAGWDTRPTKVMWWCIGFVSSMVATNAQILRMQFRNSLRVSPLIHSVKLSEEILTSSGSPNQSTSTRIRVCCHLQEVEPWF